MKYFDILGLSREPFSNSPDPAFFYESTNHVQCLHRIEIAIRLRRGLNVCLGEIGTGKTTVCRTLIQQLDRDNTIVSHLILDPYFTSGLEFLSTLHARLLGKPSPDRASRWELTESIKDHLFHEALENEKILVLIVDEGQKLCPDCLEVLRELLNYETNDAKLLQVVIFAQNEFSDMLAERPNFRDRINEFCRLEPLNFNETKALIRHRLRLAGTSKELFTRSAYRTMFRVTQGHPRKLMHIGHKVLLTLIMNNHSKATRDVVVSSARAQGYLPPRSPRLFWLLASLALILLVSVAVMVMDKNDLAGSSEQRTGPSVRQTWPVERSIALPSETSESLEIQPLVPQDANGAMPAQPSSSVEPLSPNEHEEKLSSREKMTIMSSDTAEIVKKPTIEDMFFIQVGSFQVRQNAERLVSRYLEKSYPVQMRTVVRNDRPWFIVLVHGFSDAQKARAWAVDFRDKEQRDAVVVDLSYSGYRVLGDDDGD